MSIEILKPIKHNLKTLYKEEEVAPKALRPAFTGVFSQLQRGKVFEQYKFLDLSKLFSSLFLKTLNLQK